MKILTGNIRDLAFFIKKAKEIDTPYGKKIIDESYEIPYLAGYNKDGKTIYIDKRLNPVFKLKDGRKMDMTKYLIVHEASEKYFMDVKGWKYPYAHEKATAVERESVKKDKYPWEEYQRHALSEVQRFKKLDTKAPIPKDLDIKPELDTEDYSFLKEIRKHQKINLSTTTI